VINGYGGTIGPDLSEEGEKPPEQYDFSRLSGQRTSFAWHVAHFKDPRALVAETVMPNFNFTTEQAQALSMLVLSWRRHGVPAKYLAGAPRTDPRTAEELRAEAEMKTGPGAWFVQTGCFVCHSVSALGVKSPAQIGPDLSIAVEDVQKRFGVTLDDFLQNPTGTMSVVLSRQIILSPEQKQVAVQKLREAFDAYQRQRAAGVTSAASH
jgi:cbb3-type cytochrome oxidase cytochrome c subunit